MYLSGEILKRLFVGIMAAIYLGGIFAPSIVYTAHDMHHIMAHTLYKHFLHEYEHFAGVLHDHTVHGHNHNGMIDFALDQLGNDEGSHKERESPFTVSLFKYNDHVKSHYLNIQRRYSLKQTYIIFKIYGSSLTDPEPAIPPPKNG